MKTVLATLIATAGFALAGSALAAAMPAVGQQKCGACHAVDHKVVGPAFKDVAAKYKGKKDAAELIAKSIKTGGSFGWKYGAMPPRGLGASDADVDTMSKFIAGLDK
jgi:cytochrome c